MSEDTGDTGVSVDDSKREPSPTAWRVHGVFMCVFSLVLSLVFRQARAVSDCMARPWCVCARVLSLGKREPSHHVHI